MSEDSRVYLVFEPKSGSELHACIREALIVSLTEKRTGTLTYNGREYKIEPFDAISTIMGQFVSVEE